MPPLQIHPKSLKIFSGTSSQYLAKEVAKHYGISLGKVTLQKFSDGEMAPYYEESIRGYHIYIIQSTCSPAENIIELLLMIDAAKRASAASINVVIPYFGYARQDRKDKSRIAIGAKLMSNLLVSSGASRIISCDLHADQIQGFMDIPVDHLQGHSIFIPYLKKHLSEDTVFVAPDVGSVARIRRYANYFEKGMAICSKERKRANEVATIEIIGDVSGKHVVIIDDIIDTAGTVCNAAQLIKQRGAKSIKVISTHPVLSADSIKKIENSQIEKVVVSNTIPLKTESSKIEVISIARLIAEAIRRIHNLEGIGSLFIF